MIRLLLFSLCLCVSSLLAAADAGTVAADHRALLDQYCVICHNQAVVNSIATPNEGLQTTQLRNLGLTLDTENVSRLSENPEVW